MEWRFGEQAPMEPFPGCLLELSKCLFLEGREDSRVATKGKSWRRRKGREWRGVGDEREGRGE